LGAQIILNDIFPTGDESPACSQQAPREEGLAILSGPVMANRFG